ncbi:phage/plasmid primase, P4 family [Marivita sp. XM-24bin2]|uniref:phage/plasmid primase, P4 family n=1 Tax=Marivita sp. XM-24bin2 TaxID=2133951 RepID=UPI000D797F76|nr:phage/plasmid primase, P4 family [Marivita sp. XM-24bin2]PWL32730.1 MAG: hypothetical protein DCO97_21090 [Marivita sp. XM-24bin2]
MCAKRNTLQLSQKDVAVNLSAGERLSCRLNRSTGEWMVFTEGNWRVDRLGAIRHEILCIAEAQVHDPDDRPSVLNNAFVSGTLKLAENMPCFSTVSDDWDQNPFLLGTPSGTVDLKTGEFRAAEEDDLISKSTSVDPAETEDCSKFKAFLDFSTNKDSELIGFLQKWLGYLATGDMSEQKLVYLYGPGGNGKGVLIRAILGILGDYARIVPESTLIARGNTHPTDLALLEGLRFAAATETETGSRWREGIINQVTGADPLTARRMRGEFFTFQPQCKLMISGNTAPDHNRVNDAAKRRFKVVEMRSRVPEDQVNLHLDADLRAEYPGILRWIINGCLAWQEQGLGSCHAVDRATDGHFKEQDLLERWLEEYVIVDHEEISPISDLYHSWRGFLQAAGEDPESQRAFSKRLSAAGYPSEVRKLNGQSTRVRLGLGLPN